MGLISRLLESVASGPPPDALYTESGMPVYILEGAPKSKLESTITNVAQITSLQQVGINEFQSEKLDAIFPTVFATPVHQAAAVKGLTLLAPTPLGIAGLASAYDARYRPPPPEPELAPIRPFTHNQENLMFDVGSGFNLSETLVGLGNAYVNYRNQRAGAAAISGSMAMPGMTASILPVGAGMAAAGARVASSLPSFLGLGGAMAAAGGAIRSATGKIVGFFVGGRRVSRKAGVSLAKKVGLEAAAAALGVGALELAQAVLSEEESKARARGGRAITAAQLRTTRRTIGRVERAHRQIVGFCAAARVARRAPPAARRRK